MRTSFLLFACFTCAGYGREVQSKVSDGQGDAFRALKALGTLLAGSDKHVTGFQATGVITPRRNLAVNAPGSQRFKSRTVLMTEDAGQDGLDPLYLEMQERIKSLEKEAAASGKDELTALEVSAEEIATAARILRRMRPSDLTLPKYSQIVKYGVPLLRQEVLKDMLSQQIIEDDMNSMNAGELKEFNSNLYGELKKRPDYLLSELYEKMQAEDPLISELRKRREMVEDSPMPHEEQTVGDVIELVLRVLRSKWPHKHYGIEVLRNYASPASALCVDNKNQSDTAFLDYFHTSKYGILLDFESIQYLKGLEVSPGGNSAIQQLHLVSRTGHSVPVTFRLSKHQREQGNVWLIDQLLVKPVKS
mmetsp:Transcript_136263/g.236934  ORF Transcript_136263/g.236934 Transcript_136263/m.236934 type:complete len:362 (+) Transcript_136263:61-1146(+)